jgi:hypothetical protein
MADFDCSTSFEDALATGNVRLAFPDGRSMRFNRSLLTVSSPVLRSLLRSATAQVPAEHGPQDAVVSGKRRRRLEDRQPSDEAPPADMKVGIP